MIELDRNPVAKVPLQEDKGVGPAPKHKTNFGPLILHSCGMFSERDGKINSCKKNPKKQKQKKGKFVPEISIAVVSFLKKMYFFFGLTWINEEKQQRKKAEKVVFAKHKARSLVKEYRV